MTVQRCKRRLIVIVILGGAHSGCRHQKSCQDHLRLGIIEELSFTTIRQRLISALVRLAESEGKRTERGIEFQLPASHQELASQLGTVRELISRNLMRLQAEGLLEVDARQIVVKDMKGLSALLEATN